MAQFFLKRPKLSRQFLQDIFLAHIHLGHIFVAIEIKKSPKLQQIAQSGHSDQSLPIPACCKWIAPYACKQEKCMEKIAGLLGIVTRVGSVVYSNLTPC